MSTKTLVSTPEFYSKNTYNGSYETGTVNTTNSIHQKVSLYIEGVEVPYTMISISQALGSMPMCEIEVPPSPGLMEIVRYYQPKVHVFFKDNDRGGDRLLFWGHVSVAAYSRSRAGPGNSAIHFQCVHRLGLLKEILLSFGNQLPRQESGGLNVDPKPEEAKLMSYAPTSIYAIVQAMQGVVGVQSEDKDLLEATNSSLMPKADPAKLPKYLEAFEKRLIGMPGVLVNLWNQIKRSSCYDPPRHVSMLGMYIPLFEQGLSFLKRMSGHYTLEEIQQNDRMEYCPKGGQKYNIIVPPSCRIGTTSAIQADLGFQMLAAGISGSGEMASFMDLCNSFFESILYEILILASPAEVAVDPTIPPGFDSNSLMAVETILKPKMPFYYAPVCNVIYPKMFEAVSITQQEDTIPTRIVASHAGLPSNSTAILSHYRGPASVREAFSIGSYINRGSKKYDLRNTTQIDYGVPGKFEQGRGILPMRIILPFWLTLLAKNKNAEGPTRGTEVWPTDPEEYYELLLAKKDWNQRYAIKPNPSNIEGEPIPVPEKEFLNPNNSSTGIYPHERIMFNSVDYEFSKAVAGARTGYVGGVFNPYIVVGYPMDVIDDSPNCPSFHALCSSVTHSITPTFMSTSVGMVAAVTYEELSNYYTPPAHPWLMRLLGIINEEPLEGEASPVAPTMEGDYGDISGIGNVVSTILQNPKAKIKADNFYYSVLGVGAADPTTMYDFMTQQAIPQMRRGNSHIVEALANGSNKMPSSSGGDNNDWNTTPGNLRLVARNIESKDAIASKFDYQFIDMTFENYSGQATGYSNPKLMNKQLLEPGQSLFLNYKEAEDYIEDRFATDKGQFL